MSSRQCQTNVLPKMSLPCTLVWYPRVFRDVTHRISAAFNPNSVFVGEHSAEKTELRSKFTDEV